MCIRDREHDARTWRRLAQEFMLQGLVEQNLEHGALHITEAVSYTHLRAHETVLDLVCRLLLEKKKTHTKLRRLAYVPQLTNIQYNKRQKTNQQ